MRDSSGNVSGFRKAAERAADAIRGADYVKVITHIDADGISAGSIASLALDRLGIAHEVVFEKKITEEVVSGVNTCKDLVWICDLGSGYASEFSKNGLVITDHHVPDSRKKRRQTVLEDFVAVYHVNPHLFGMDGSREISGAGVTYEVAKKLNPENTDLAYLAVIGAVGDFQDSVEYGLTGMNRSILEDAVKEGDVIAEKDLRLFGRETRSLIQYLQYSNEPELPGLTNSGPACARFYSELGISLNDGGRTKSWNDLGPKEKSRVTEKLVELVGSDKEHMLIGEVYTLPKFEKGTGLRDAKDYATLLNSCGRYDDAETGMRICKGDMSALADAEANRTEHRRNISGAINYIKENRLIRERRFLQYFDAGDEIKETVVGIVAGMVLNSGICKRELPIIAFADAEDGIKVSARADHSLMDRGLNLSFVMKTAAEHVGGFGGGHSIAAGATIPPDKKEEFLEAAEDLISCQVI